MTFPTTLVLEASDLVARLQSCGIPVDTDFPYFEATGTDLAREMSNNPGPMLILNQATNAGLSTELSLSEPVWSVTVLGNQMDAPFSLFRNAKHLAHAIDWAFLAIDGNTQVGNVLIYRCQSPTNGPAPGPVDGASRSMYVATYAFLVRSGL